ncbi:MAG: hypothetical protein GTO02_11165 [Candidatus Dadabacteria bacterium]|nr:hypothetical protein [Candidatus Dadabacteria bacterium]
MKKLKKKELQVLLNKYKKQETPTNKKETKPVNVKLREFTDSEDEADDQKKENKGFTVTFKTGKDKEDDNDKLPDRQPVLKRQNGYSKKEIQTEVKKMCNNFSLFISEMIKQFKEDNDAEYVVSNYNVHRADIETEITDYLNSVDADDSLFEYANQLLKIQQNRIEKLLGMK